MTNGTAPRPDAAALSQALKVLAPVLELFDASPLHYMHKVSFLVDRLLPSLLNGQFRLLMRNDQPLAFVNWAWVTPEISERLALSQHQLTQAQWNCGTDLWFCEIVVREGMMHTLIRDLANDVFPPGTRARWLRVGPSGAIKGVGEIRMPGKP